MKKKNRICLLVTLLFILVAVTLGCNKQEIEAPAANIVLGGACTSYTTGITNTTNMTTNCTSITTTVDSTTTSQTFLIEETTIETTPSESVETKSTEITQLSNETISESEKVTEQEISHEPEKITEPISAIENQDSKKTIEEIAYEVWEGKWGNGADRKALLEQAGYNYEEVQNKVNEIRPTSNSTNEGYSISYVKEFSRGTYYAYGYSCCGGSGRSLIDCSWGDGTVKGSIASSYLYYNYGYNYNGKRTMVYLEVYGYPSMNGYYYLDDCDAGNSNVIDFYYTYNSNCPFQYQGVVGVSCSIVNY